MKNVKKLPDSELEIMMKIWEADECVTCDRLMENLDRPWAKTTVLNFLNRLCERGFLSCRKEGRVNVYSPMVKKETYINNVSRTFFEKIHHSSIKSLIASLYDGDSITKEDAEELKKFIEEKY